jgi:dynein heavy chain
MNSVLVQELERYNALVKLVTTSLEGLLKTLSGEQLASAATEQLFGPVLLGDVPERWLKVSYPSQKSLAGYIADLCRRLAIFENWVSDGPPTVFWLPGFYSPQSFLTAIL